MLDIDIQRKAYPAASGNAENVIFSDFRLHVGANEFVCLFGPSGCGKTTLLNLVAGLDTDFAGSVVNQSDAEKRTGYVFQEPRLLPWRTVRDNIRLTVLDDPDRLAAIDEVIETVGLSALANAFPRQLSAGQARRAALARAFAAGPTLLLMDEPFVSLDDPSAERLRRVLIETWIAHPATILFVTHDLDEALLLADRIVLLGGRPLDIIEDRRIEVPRDAREDSAALALLRAEFDARRRETSPGDGADPGAGP